MIDPNGKNTKFKSMPIQEGINHIQKEIADLRSLTLAQITLEKLTLRVFLDLGYVELENLTAALKELAEEEKEDSQAQKLFLDLISSFEASHGRSGEHSGAPRLLLVPKEEDEPQQ